MVSSLRDGVAVPPEQFKETTIFFSDIVGFTNIASAVKPIKVVELLNNLYTVMDMVTAGTEFRYALLPPSQCLLCSSGVLRLFPLQL